MNDDTPGTPRPHDETQPVRADGGAALPPAPAAEPAPVAAPPTGRRGFRERFGALRRSDGDRTFGLAALIASALAGVIVGGLGLAAIQAVGDDHDHGRGGWMQQRGPMGGGRDGDFGDRGDRRPMFGGPGQVQPTAPPDDDSSGS